MKLAVLGGGSWGTALSIALAPRFETLSLWVFETDLAARLKSTRENDVFLPGFKIPEKIDVVSEVSCALGGASIVLCVVPSLYARSIYQQALPHLQPSMKFVSATKGLEHDTLLRMSEVLVDVVSRDAGFQPQVAVLSGPTFAREIAQGSPAALVVASTDNQLAAQVQTAFSGPGLRLYTNSDTIGVELGGALKNVIAIAAGVVQGLGLGSNTMAALITRGLAEITRLSVAMGARAETLAGLAGLGDLVLTCNGELSRNRRVGMELAKGLILKEILASTRTVAEGVETCASAVALGSKFAVDLPIIQQMHAVLNGSKDPKRAIRDLMDRSLKGE